MMSQMIEGGGGGFGGMLGTGGIPGGFGGGASFAPEGYGMGAGGDFVGMLGGSGGGQLMSMIPAIDADGQFLRRTRPPSAPPAALTAL
jgi:hypothetical protein